MSRTLTALFDHRADAEAAKERLKAASIDISNVHIHDQASAGDAGAGTSNTAYSTQESPGFWGSVKGAFLPDEDRHTYEEGVRRGGYLLTAQVDEHDADKAVRVLDEAASVDLDQRSSEWRQSGWNYAGGAAAGTGAGTGLFGSSGASDTTSDRLTSAGAGAGTEERIALLREELKVGKREVERGGVRVRSYVVETPVQESVNLREEHVSIERRAVDEPISGATANAFQERTVEMTERSEEAVVAKDARVVEEVVIRKDAGERTETVADTVRHTEVEVENTGTRGTTGGAGFTGTTPTRDGY